MVKQVKLKKDTATMLNVAKGTIQLLKPHKKITDNATIHYCLKSYLNDEGKNNANRTRKTQPN